VTDLESCGSSGRSAVSEVDAFDCRSIRGKRDCRKCDDDPSAQGRGEHADDNGRYGYLNPETRQ